MWETYPLAYIQRYYLKALRQRWKEWRGLVQVHLSKPMEEPEWLYDPTPETKQAEDEYAEMIAASRKIDVEAIRNNPAMKRTNLR